MAAAEPYLERPSTEPDGAARLPILDVLRGVAILGILFMNIEAMGGPFAALDSADPRLFGWTAADRVAWWLKTVLAEGTARGLLEMLFGAGMVILTDRAATRLSARAVVRGYAWRNLVLFALGLVHVFVLLWPGDILHTYALAALVMVLLRHLPPRLMLTLGLSMALLQLVGLGSAAIAANAERAAVTTWHTEQRAGRPLPADALARMRTYDRWQADMRRQRAANRRAIAAENAARTRDAAGWIGSAWRSFLMLQAGGLELAFVWEATSTMLIGAALFRWGVLQGRVRVRAAVALVVAGYGIGLPLRIWEGGVLTRFDHLPSMAGAFAEPARLFVTIGHVGAAQLLLVSQLGARLLAPFRSAGRVALSLYLLQSIAALWFIYPPWGLALYARQGWAAMMATAALIDAVLLIAAVWWVRRYSIGPVEWAWRSTVAGRGLPFGRSG